MDKKGSGFSLQKFFGRAKIGIRSEGTRCSRSSSFPGLVEERLYRRHLGCVFLETPFNVHEVLSERSVTGPGGYVGAWPRGSSPPNSLAQGWGSAESGTPTGRGNWEPPGRKVLYGLLRNSLKVKSLYSDDVKRDN